VLAGFGLRLFSSGPLSLKRRRRRLRANMYEVLLEAKIERAFDLEQKERYSCRGMVAGVRYWRPMIRKG